MIEGGSLAAVPKDDEMIGQTTGGYKFGLPVPVNIAQYHFVSDPDFGDDDLRFEDWLCNCNLTDKTK